jgi:predicted nucleic acid-binding Zn finger protein
MFRQKVMSESTPNVMYIVSKNPIGEITCTCPHFVYRGLSCKHIDSVRFPSVPSDQIDSNGRWSWFNTSQRFARVLVPSETEPRVFYTVSRNDAGEETCTCPHFIHRGVTCKHIYFVRGTRMIL